MTLLSEELVFSGDDFVKLLMAVTAGGLIGMEREFREKAAGFRTLIFICVGSALFTMFSLKLGAPDDTVRIAANIVSGIGFLGAGVILRDRGRVVGLTTASTIWLTAALGMGIGGGYYVLAGISVVVILAILWGFPLFEHLIGTYRETRMFEVTCPVSHQKFEQLTAIFKEHGLHVKTRKQAKSGDQMICTWEAHGPPKKHDQVVKLLFADPDIKEFRF